MAANAARIAVVDVNFIFQQSRRGRAVAAKLQLLRQEWQRRLAQLEARRHAFITKVQAGSNSLSPPAAMDAQSELQAIDLELQYLRRRSEADMKGKVQHLQQSIMSELQPLLVEFSRRQGLLAIFPTPNTPLLFVDASLDLTKQVLAYYDSKSAA